MTKNERHDRPGGQAWASWASAVGAGVIAGACASMFLAPQPSAAGPAALRVAAVDNRAVRDVLPPPQDGIAPFKLTVEPKAVVTGAKGGQQLKAEAKISNNLGKRASFQISQALIDARGNVIAAPSKLTAEAVAAGGSFARVLNSPEDLPDGYYKWRVLAAGSDGDADTVQESEAYFSVKSGSVTPMDMNEWYALPEVNMAVDG